MLEEFEMLKQSGLPTLKYVNLDIVPSDCNDINTSCNDDDEAALKLFVEYQSYKHLVAAQEMEAALTESSAALQASRETYVESLIHLYGKDAQYDDYYLYLDHNENSSSNMFEITLVNNPVTVYRNILPKLAPRKKECPPKFLHKNTAVTLDPRKRGRPPKSAHKNSALALAPRKRGRPPKSAHKTTAVTLAPRKRGRPPKSTQNNFTFPIGNLNSGPVLIEVLSSNGLSNFKSKNASLVAMEERRSRQPQKNKGHTLALTEHSMNPIITDENLSLKDAEVCESSSFQRNKSSISTSTEHSMDPTIPGEDPSLKNAEVCESLSFQMNKGPISAHTEHSIDPILLGENPFSKNAKVCRSSSSYKNVVTLTPRKKRSKLTYLEKIIYLSESNKVSSNYRPFELCLPEVMEADVEKVSSYGKSVSVSTYQKQRCQPKSRHKNISTSTCNSAVSVCQASTENSLSATYEVDKVSSLNNCVSKRPSKSAKINISAPTKNSLPVSSEVDKVSSLNNCVSTSTSRKRKRPFKSAKKSISSPTKNSLPTASEVDKVSYMNKRVSASVSRKRRRPSKSAKKSISLSTCDDVSSDSRPIENLLSKVAEAEANNKLQSACENVSALASKKRRLLPKPSNKSVSFPTSNDVSFNQAIEISLAKVHEPSFYKNTLVSTTKKKRRPSKRLKKNTLGSESSGVILNKRIKKALAKVNKPSSPLTSSSALTSKTRKRSSKPLKKNISASKTDGVRFQKNTKKTPKSALKNNTIPTSNSVSLIKKPVKNLLSKVADVQRNESSYWSNKILFVSQLIPITIKPSPKCMQKKVPNPVGDNQFVPIRPKLKENEKYLDINNTLIHNAKNNVSSSSAGPMEICINYK